MTTTLDVRALNMLIARMSEEAERRNAMMRSAKDYSDLQRIVGFLDAFDAVAKLCEEVERDLFTGKSAADNKR